MKTDLQAERPRSAPLVRMRGISKRFPAVLANDRVDLDLYPGEVHALLGENGAGKSTLVKILYGFYQADQGQIVFEGRPVAIRSPQEARALRLGMVFQDLTLIPAMTVVENIALFLPDLGPTLNERVIAERITNLAARYGFALNTRARVRDLAIGEQQKAEILRLLLADARVLILDEPTRVLAPHEVEGLFHVFGRLRADGYAIVFITHKLGEVLACADRITVMRAGRVSGTLPRREATEARLVSLMFGGAPPRLSTARPPTARAGTGPVLELIGVATRPLDLSVPLRDLDLAVHPGEIVGVAGVSGNGQKELGDLVLGLTPPSAGSKRLFGRDAGRWSVEQVRRSGVAFIPEDPLRMAAVPDLSVLANAALVDTRKYGRRGGLALDWPAARRDLLDSFAHLGFQPPKLELAVRSLSGGTLQRFVLAREFSTRPRLVLALYPTRGLDVPSAISARNRLIAARNSGASVLLISEDLDEAFALSDRLAVMREGRIVGIFEPGQISRTEIGHMMTDSRVERG